MFEIVKVLGKGWLGTKVVVRARSAMKHRKKIFRFGRLYAPGLDTWQIDIERDESFTVRLPPGGEYRAGQLLKPESLLNARPMRSRWRKMESF